MAKSKRATYSLLTDARTMEDRLRLAGECAESLRGYNDRFHELESRPGLDARMTERAHEAERNFRILLKTGLDTINEIWDSGEASSVIHIPIKTESDLSREFSAAAASAKSFLSGRYPGMDVSPLDDAVRLLEDHKVRFSPSRNGGFALHLQDPSGRHYRQEFHVDPRPGDSGRVSSSAFFSPGFAPVFGRVPGMYKTGGCHEAPWNINLVPPSSAGLYGALVGSLGVSREAIYRHAREVEEFGPAFARGAGPAVGVIALVALAIALFCLAAGGTIWILCQDKGNQMSSDVCDAGNWLLGIGCVLALLAAILSGAQITYGPGTDPSHWPTVDPNTGQVSSYPVNNPSSK